MPPEREPRVEHELFLRSALNPPPDARIVEQLVPLLEDVHAEAGTTLFRAGEDANDMYFVVYGDVEMRLDGRVPWHFHDGSLLGVIDANLRRPYQRTAVTVSPAHLIHLSYADFIDVLEDNPEYVLRGLQANAQRGDELLRQLAADMFVDADAVRHPELVVAPGRPPLHAIERLLRLRATGVFARAPVQALASLARVTRQREVAAGEAVFTEGDRRESLTVLVGGRVLLSLEEPHVAATLAPLRVIAELGALGFDRQRYTATAIEPAVVLEVAIDELFDVAEDHFGLVGSIYAHLSEEWTTLNTRASERGLALGTPATWRPTRPPR